MAPTERYRLERDDHGLLGHPQAMQRRRPGNSSIASSETTRGTPRGGTGAARNVHLYRELDHWLVFFRHPAEKYESQLG